MTDFLDFLSFRRYVSPYVLLFFYYLGAVLMPLAMVFFWAWLKRRFPVLDDARRQLGDVGRSNFSSTQRVSFLLACIFCFILAELFWRMMFEFMIAYFHMASDLQKLAH